MVMVKKSFINSMQGLDEDYEGMVSFLDLCIKARSHGKYVKLIPYELGSISFKKANELYSEKELNKLFDKYFDPYLTRDPYFPVSK